MGEQSRIVSLIEVGVNILTGFAVAMLVWSYVIPELFPRMVGPVSENFTITLVFTVTSIARSYLWRRFFNNGFHATLASWFSRTAGGDSDKIGGNKGVGTAEIIGHWVTDTGICAPECPLCNDEKGGTQ